MPELITSKDNAWLKGLRRLAQDNNAYRQMGEVWLEGEHLVDAVARKGRSVRTLVCAESFWPQMPSDWTRLGQRQVLLPDVLFTAISGLESPARIGLTLTWSPKAERQCGVSTVVLDRVQDAGNVGSILRTAAAMGVSQVLAMQGTAALWSPKVLRAGMGAHLSLALHEGLHPADLTDLGVPLLVTSSHQGPFLHELLRQGALPTPAAWVLGHEGQGVASELLARADLQVRISQPGGEESLNVAAAAAICLHASATAA
ncbi:MAG: RNA methyltransferase [Alphaproteobacteria bacterium]|nr:RNA methyltransferase [Alphaproteobacteria bacterium]